MIYPWQQPAWRQIHGYIAQQRIPQALLITGQKGLGKQQLAEKFAYSLLCTERQSSGFACGVCDSCLLRIANNHPDLIALYPEEPGKAISIGQIRQLIVPLSLKPHHDGFRVVIINPAEQLTNAAANAFLKCLEEPNERTVIMLISERPAKLPATIRSRCQKLLIAQLARAEVSAWLQQQQVQQHHELLYSLAQGSPLLAKQYAQDQTLSTRQTCFQAWLGIAKQQDNPVLVAESWFKLPESALLFWLSTWLIDLTRLAFQPNIDNLYNPDLAKPLKELSVQLNLQQVYGLYDLLLLSRQRLETQINKQSLFEEILLRWAEINRSQ